MKLRQQNKLSAFLGGLLLLCIACGPVEETLGEESSSAEPSTPASFEEVLAAYPVTAQLPEGERYQTMWPIAGDEEHILLMTEDGQGQKNLYHCEGKTGKCLLLLEDIESWDLAAGLTPEGSLRIVTQKEAFLLSPEGEAERLPLGEDQQWENSYNFPRELLFWRDPETVDLLYDSLEGGDPRVLWEPTLRKNTGPYPDVDDQGNTINTWGAPPAFSASGRLAFFCELGPNYTQRPILLDLETGERWEAAEAEVAPAMEWCMVGETGVLSRFLREGREDGEWDAIRLVTLEGGMEERALGFFYQNAYPGRDCLYLEEGSGRVLRLNLETMETESLWEPVQGYYAGTVTGTSCFDAVSIGEARYGGRQGVAILPRGPHNI